MHAPALRRIAAFAVLPLALVLVVSRFTTVRTGPLRELARVAETAGPDVAPRLSISPAEGRGGGARTRRTDRELSAVEKRLTGSGRDDSSPELLHARSLLYLGWGRTVEQATRAVAGLETVLSLQGPSAGVLADLAAAHLVLAERAGTPRDLFEAVENAEWALELDSLHAPARFNLALALHRLMLDGEAARALKSYVAVDPTSGWALEARARLDSLSKPLGPPRPPAGATPAQLAEYAARAPQEARVLAFDTLLGTWGGAVLRGDTAAAAADLRRAAAVAEALERRPGGDASLGDAVRAIRAHAADRAATRELATAHEAYARALPYLIRRDTASARRGLETALAHANASPSLAAWAEYSRGIVLFYRNDARAWTVFGETAARVDTVRYPVLAGRTQWSLGVRPLRKGRFAESRAHFVRAARLFERAGEREHLGGARGLETEALFGLGNEDEGYASMSRALETLRPYRSSLWMHNLLYVTGQAATTRGLKRTALRMQDEQVAVGERVRPGAYAEALLVRALARMAAGDHRGATADVRASSPVVASLPPGPERDWLEADLRLGASGLLLRSLPDSAVAGLGKVIAAFKGNPNRVLPARVLRAEAHLAAGSVNSAVADLDSAAIVLDSLSSSLSDAATRAAMLEAGRGVYDRLVMLHVREGRIPAALVALERGRASFGPAGPQEPVGRAAMAAPEGETVLEYAMIGDTLLVFSVSGRTVELHKRTVDRSALLRSITHLRSAMELRAPADSLGADLTGLYDRLIRPVRARLGGGSPLVVVADGELAGVPFAALHDRERKRYLVQDHRIRFAGTLAGAARRPARPGGAGEPALFVADPAFARREHPGLLRLSGSADETRTIARGYPGSVVLADTAARRDTLAAELVRASLFHFAGHAVFDDQRPGRSYLVLAPGRDGTGRLTAEEIARLDLRHLRLAVLSACQTQRSVGGRSGGFAGLSGAMIAAGAGGVVGSLWRVDDGHTRELMSAFHTAYRGSGDGADALRRAQLHLLRSGDTGLSSPSAWAGFRYAGN